MTAIDRQPEFPQGVDIPLDKVSGVADLAEWIYTHRFVTSRQLAGAYPGIRTEVTARRYLRRLRHYGVLQTTIVRRDHFRRDFAQHYVTLRGLNLIARQREKLGLRFDGRREDSHLRGRTEETSKHEEGLTDVQIQIERLAVEKGNRFHLIDRRFRGTKGFRPDWAFLAQTKSGQLYPLTLVEYDRCSKTLDALFKQFERYVKWWETDARQYLVPFYQGWGSQNPRNVFRLCFVVDRGYESESAEQIRVSQLVKKAREFPPEFQSMVWIIGTSELFSTPTWQRPHQNPMRLF